MLGMAAATLGDPSPLARDLMDACLQVQRSVRKPLRPGLPCNELLRHGERTVREHRFAPYGRLVAYGRAVAGDLGLRPRVARAAAVTEGGLGFTGVGQTPGGPGIRRLPDLFTRT